jgi:hypothetical protein
MPWDVNPLYALLHEPIYCQGAASNWAAQRVREQAFAADFDAVAALEDGAPPPLVRRCCCCCCLGAAAAVRFRCCCPTRRC